METGRVRKLRKLNGLEIYEYIAPKPGVIPGRAAGASPESINTAVATPYNTGHFVAMDRKSRAPQAMRSLGRALRGLWKVLATVGISHPASFDRRAGHPDGSKCWPHV